jgi:ABC-type glycerol-3-phosphate transport system permease component
LRGVPRYAILLIATVASLYPMLWVVTVAFKTQGEYAQDSLSLPSSLSFENFKTVFENDEIWTYVTNSIIVVVTVVPVLFVVLVVAGYARAGLWRRGPTALLFLFLVSELVPITILAIPLLLTVKEIGIETGVQRLFFVYVVMMMGFGVLVCRAYFRSIPEELFEAARLDGCGEFGAFWRIGLPLARSAVLFIAVIAVIVVWNEIFLAVILLDSSEGRTLAVGLTEFRARRTTNWPVVAAALVMSTLPTAVLYMLFQSRITQAMSRSTTL